ncbi:MAG TPA: hypothetical protein VM597_40865 [Gemmataceae bacterium]|nr:hypothetical protein [Gemmataceae bacterium]
MQLIAPDVLTEARGLSTGATVTALVIGLLLWLFGWRWHRFWTVVGITVAGGLYGLSVGQPVGGPAIAVGVLLAVAAGLLALELARLFAFVAGGTAAWLAAAAFMPNGQELGLFFLGGGLAGLLFYRLWMMALTTLLGTLIAGHAGFLLAEEFARVDAAGWAGRNPMALSVAVGLVSLLGLAAQGAQARRAREWEEEERRYRRRRWGWFRRRHDRHEPADVRALRDVFTKKD